MNLILLNYIDKQDIISYDIEDNSYVKIKNKSNYVATGYYDIWKHNIFGVFLLEQEIYVFIEGTRFSLNEIKTIKNRLENKNSFFELQTKRNTTFSISIEDDLSMLCFDYIIESGDNLGVCIENIWRDGDSRSLFKNNVINRLLRC